MTQQPGLTKPSKQVMPYVIIAIILVIGVTHFTNTFWSELKSRFAAGQTRVYFHELTNFEWDTVCILEPYSTPIDPPRKVELKQLFEDNDPRDFVDKLPDLGDDGKWAFAFVRNKKVVAIRKRGFGLYVYERYDRKCIPKPKAAFEKEGYKVYITDIASSE